MTLFFESNIVPVLIVAALFVLGGLVYLAYYEIRYDRGFPWAACGAALVLLIIVFFVATF